MTIARRDFLKAAPMAALAIAQTAKAAAFTLSALNKISAFDYVGVRLRESRWQKQFQHARDFYLHLSNDDILHGFRVGAALPSTGKPLGGWAARSTGGIF